MLTTTSAPTPPSPLWASTTVFGVANAIGFGMSAATGWHYHLDLIGTGAFTFAAAATSGGALRQRVSAAFVGLWATKLAAFLFYRALQTHHDSRLEKTLSTTKGAAGFWSASFAWGVVCFLPHSVAAGRAGPALGSVIGGLGLAAMATGLTLETLADAQKWQLKQDPSRHGQFCDVGVWQICQHPNWFGNLLFWSGVLVFNTPAIIGPSPALGGLSRCLLGACGPAFMLALFWGEATGAILDGVQLNDTKYGADPRYREYVKSTPLLFPTPEALGRLFASPSL